MKHQINLEVLLGCMLIVTCNSWAENIALGAPCTFNPAPNYAHCSDADDAKQLTDGQYVQGHFWTQQGTVGWVGACQVIITLDLGGDKPISGVSFSTAAGAAGVEWPKSIGIFTAGADGLFHDVGELTLLSAQHSAPPSEGYTVHRYSTDALHTHGSRVALILFGEPFIFCDEIEVQKGENVWVNEPLPGAGVTDLRDHITRLITHNGVKRRILADINAVRKAAENLGEEDRAGIHAELDAIIAELDTFPAEYGPDFKTILPINATHAKVFSVLASVWKKNGLQQMAVWAVDPWYPMELCPAIPGSQGADATRLHLDMMQNEVRPVAFNVASAEELEAVITIAGLPDNLEKPCLDVFRVAWTDTRSGEPVAAALLPLQGTGNTWRVHLVPGLVQQIWLSVNSKELAPGNHDFMIRVNDDIVPFTVQVYPIRFPDRPTLHTGGWDYTNVLHHYEVTEANRAALVNMLREYHVDSPWAVNSALPFGTHDESGAMTAPPDTANFNAWRQLWPDARRYCVFSAVGENFQKFPMGTAEFNKAVGDWAKFWAQYMRDAGLDPEQLLVLLVDEPYEPKMDVVITHWAKAIHDSGAGILVWEDPTYKDMSDATPEMIASCDVLCPNRSLFYGGGESYRAFFAEQRAKGKELEFYSCSGPMRLLDPNAYCRLQAWDCWRYGATASYFWAFADGAGGSSWNEYPQPRNAYTPIFIDAETVVPGKHLEAMRAGVQDYEYFVMLQKAIENWKGDAAVRESAEVMLRELPDRVCAVMLNEGRQFWKPSATQPTADLARLEILRTLLRLTE